MSLIQEDAKWEAAFEHIECPVCGCEDWRLLPAQGIFCDGCNCRVQLRHTMGDRGFIADFDASSCWSKTVDDSDRIPEHSSMGRKAYAKYMGTDETGYSRQYLAVYAVNDDEVAPDVWTPAWNRSAELDETNE